MRRSVRRYRHDFYAAIKAEVLILTRRVAVELGRRGVTVNAVAPGWIVTEMARAGRTEEEFQVRVRSMSERTRGSLAWKMVAPLGTTIGPVVRVGCVGIIGRAAQSLSATSMKLPEPMKWDRIVNRNGCPSCPVGSTVLN
jgi:NAD(P)-dependent dehydrogenase (short-subunit alcohol dehydrogenase family)